MYNVLLVSIIVLLVHGRIHHLHLLVVTQILLQIAVILTVVFQIVAVLRQINLVLTK